MSVEWLATGNEAGAVESKGPVAEDFAFMIARTIRAHDSRPAVRSNQIVDHLAVRAAWVRERLNADPSNLILFQARGDSMTPGIRDGDLMLVDSREAFFRHDGIYVLTMGDELAVKRLQRKSNGRVAIRSDNPAYEQITVAEDALRVVGDVIWLGGALPRNR